ncbi:MAG: hypothetical protein OER88_12275, partial [Planctomycetota bacterium]|nr:hypothetical protein [Planctomycetota bacterium]
MARSRSFDKRVIRILADAEIVDAETLEQIQTVAVKEDRSVASVLLKRNLIEENELLGLMAERLRVTPVNLHDCIPDPEVVRIVPRDTAALHHLVPISRI